MNTELNKQQLIKMSSEYQKLIDELVLKLKKLDFELKSSKSYLPKEYILSQKTKEQINIEKNSPLFIKSKIKNHFHPSQLGKKEGKIKFINNINISNNKKNTSTDKTTLLSNKKLNELKIYARDLKIKNYSTLKKDELVKKINEIIKNTENETNKEIEIDDNDDDINEEFYDDDNNNEYDVDYE